MLKEQALSDTIQIKEILQNKEIHARIKQLYETGDLPDESLKRLIDVTPSDLLFDYALKRRKEYYGESVYVRGLIEFTNHCKNNCYYCGLRASNLNIERYRLTEDEIYDCAQDGYQLGFRTFVLQGGEDPWFTDDKICQIVHHLTESYPDCAVTLSICKSSSMA